MSVLESPAVAPVTFGLPEYRVTEVYTEIDGRDIRMAFGSKRFGHLEWLYTVVVSPEKLVELCQHCESVALEALSVIPLLEYRSISH